MIPTDKRIRALDSAMKSVVGVDAKACANCEFVHWEMGSGAYHCWKGLPTPIGTFVQTAHGLQLQVGVMRPPTEASAWCGEFQRKTVA